MSKKRSKSMQVPKSTSRPAARYGAAGVLSLSAESSGATKPICDLPSVVTNSVSATPPATRLGTLPSEPSEAGSVVDALTEALAAVRELTARRLEAKLSISRLNGVARELRELIKVMSVYGV